VKSNDELWLSLADSIERMRNLFDTAKLIANGATPSKNDDDRLLKMVQMTKTVQEERNRYDSIFLQLKERSQKGPA